MSEKLNQPKANLKYEPGKGIRFTELLKQEQPAKNQEKEKLPEELASEKIQSIEKRRKSWWQAASRK